MTNADRYKVLLSVKATKVLRKAQERSTVRQSLVQLIEAAIYATYGDTPQAAPPAPVVTPTPPTGRVEI